MKPDSNILEKAPRKQRILTGIKPTGLPHLGNYLGAVRPAIELSERGESRYFIADYHALNSIKNPREMQESIYTVSAAWIASGLDPERTLIYKQSDVPETFELSTMLTAYTPKGLMNRAHAYKAAVDKNREKNKPEDHGINMGLYTYPVLMAADILLFDTDLVPVGKDQVQHIEMAADIAEALNRTHGAELLVKPRPYLGKEAALIPGADGRKMSKSYQNSLPLFCSEKELQKYCRKIKTNSRGQTEPKDPESCSVFTLYRYFADPEQIRDMEQHYREGSIGWGEAKDRLYEVLNKHLSPLREHYRDLVKEKQKIRNILREGAEKAREEAAAKMKMLREAAGFCL